VIVYLSEYGNESGNGRGDGYEDEDEDVGPRREYKVVTL